MKVTEGGVGKEAALTLISQKRRMFAHFCGLGNIHV